MGNLLAPGSLSIRLRSRALAAHGNGPVGRNPDDRVFNPPVPEAVTVRTVIWNSRVRNQFTIPDSGRGSVWSRPQYAKRRWR